MGITTKKPVANHVFPILFLLTFVLGQFGRIDLLGGAVYIHEVILFLGVLYYFKSFVSFVIPAKAPESRLIPDQVRYDRYKKIIVPVIFFILAILASLVFSANIHDSSQWMLPLGYLLRFILYASLMVLVPVTGGMKTWMKALVVSGLFFSLAGIVQFFLYPDLRNISYLGWDPHYLRFVSTIFDPNIAGFMLLSFFVVTVFYFEKSSRKWYFSVLFVEALAILLTFSRSTIVTFIILTFAYAWMKKLWWPVLVGIVIAVLSIAFMPLGSLSSPMRVVSALARVENFSQGLNMFRSSPVFGVGWFMMPGFDQNSLETTRAYARLDNSFLFVLTSTGIVGFTAFLWFLSSIGARIKSTMRRVNTHSYGLFIGFEIATLLIHTQFENIFFSAWGLLWLWVSVGMLVDSGLDPE